MDMSFEDQVRECAYNIWLASGMSDGQEHEHWAMAEATVKATNAEPVVILTNKVAKPAAKGAAKAPTKAAAKAKPAAAKVAKADGASKVATKAAKPAKKPAKAAPAH